MTSEKIVIGLTGSLGSGKSTVAAMLAECGAHVIDADLLAHAALKPGSPVYAEIVKTFPAAMARDGNIDRKKMAQEVFGHAGRLKALTDLIHPYVFSRIEEEIAGAGGMVVVEVPLLYETGFEKKCRLVIYVDASPENISERLLKRGLSEKEIELRQKAQLAPEAKRNRADIVIQNDGSIQKTREEIQSLYRRISALSKGAK